MDKIVKVKAETLTRHPDNPREITESGFDKLKSSIESFPDMLRKRPLIINKQNQVIGGNMRLAAMNALGIKDAHVIIVDWDEAKQREFVIKDNIHYGDWDWDLLSKEDWTDDQLKDWGVPMFSMGSAQFEGWDRGDEEQQKAEETQEQGAVECACPHCAHEFMITEKP